METKQNADKLNVFLEFSLKKMINPTYSIYLIAGQQKQSQQKHCVAYH